MITINYKPTVPTETKSNIVFTDCGKSKPSTVFMDKQDAPAPKSLVWMQIRNPRYNPNDSLNKPTDNGVIKTTGPQLSPPDDEIIYEHADNKYYLFERWMWVENVYVSEYPAGS